MLSLGTHSYLEIHRKKSEKIQTKLVVTVVSGWQTELQILVNQGKV